MHTHKRYLLPLVVLAAVALVTVVAPRAEEGFWPYNSIPKAAIKAKYGFTVTDAWLNRLQLATVHFGGATGSVVSPNGLVLTNHHVALRSLQQLSTAERDLVRSGFVAESLADELKVPAMSLRILQSIEDVTATVNEGVTPGLSPAEINEARQKATVALQANPQPGTSKQVVSLYAGAIYNLYTYKVFTDVRLVLGAEYQTGFFGGDPDNFTYPRYNFDVSFFRLYENDKPAVTPNYLPFSANGSREGELVFTTGHPGATQRLNTLAHFQYRRDVALPFAIANNAMREAATKKWMALSAENARQSTSDLFGIQNSLKNQRGQLAGLSDARSMAIKEAAEKRLRAELAKNPAKQQELGDAWEIIEKTLAAARRLDDQRNYIANAAGLNSTLFATARTLVRAAYAPPAAAAESGRGGGRGGAAGSAARPGAKPPTVNLVREKINLTESLAFMQQQLGATHAITTRILGGKSPEARAAELIDACRLTDPEIYTLLVAGGRATIDASSDPMIVLARSLESDAQAIAKQYEDEVTSIQAATYPKIGQAVFAVDGAKAYPDATLTLRLSYGSVRGYVEEGRKVPPYTVIGGLFDRSATFNGEAPYDLAPRWSAARTALDPKVPLNFVSTNDIVGGNSGSPVVNRRGEVVGVVFDGNIQSLLGYFIYDESINRCVSVDSRAILEALRKVYALPRVADELMPKRGR